MSIPTSNPIIRTSFAGDIAFRPADIILFGQQLPGLEQSQQFLLLEEPQWRPVLILQSVDRPEVALSVAAANQILPRRSLSFQPVVDDNPPDWLRLGRLDAARTDVLVLVTVRVDEQGQLIGNLLAPLAIDLASRRGWQLICEGPLERAHFPLQDAATRDPSPGTTDAHH